LNRVSFLRQDHSFLSQAFDHGTTKFMVFKNLSPLVKTSSEISYASYNDLRSLIPTNPFEKSEKDIIKEFDSRKKIPQLVFLGLDEKVKDGLSYKNYTGAPHFAVDITPVAPYEEPANGVIAEMEKRGLTFVEGMRAMAFPAGVGKRASHADTSCYANSARVQRPYTRWAEHSSTGITATLFVAPAATVRCRSMLEQSVSAHRLTRPRLRASVHLALLEPPCPTLRFLEQIQRSLWQSSVTIANGSCLDGKSAGRQTGFQPWLGSSSLRKVWKMLFAERYGRKAASHCLEW